MDYLTMNLSKYTKEIINLNYRSDEYGSSY